MNDAQRELLALTGHGDGEAAEERGEGRASQPPEGWEALVEAALRIDPELAQGALLDLTVELALLRLAAWEVEVRGTQRAALRALRAAEPAAREQTLTGLTGLALDAPDEVQEVVRVLRAAGDAWSARNPRQAQAALACAVEWLSNPGDALLPVLQASLASEVLGRRVESPKRFKVRYPMRTKTSDDDTYATDPGGVRLSLERLRALDPELRPLSGLPALWRWMRTRVRAHHVAYWETWCREHLMHGDSRAAVVVATRPLVVACYTDELDCVALVRFEASCGAWFGARVGQRLLTVNRYEWLSEGLAQDLWEGERSLHQYGNFMPLVAEVYSEDRTRIEARKQEIDEAEWARCAALGKLLLGWGQAPRNGLPWGCDKPKGRLVARPAQLTRAACGGEGQSSR